MTIPSTDLAAEVAPLVHDIERYVDISSELATENEQFRERIARLEAALRGVRAIIVEGAAVGFNHASGSWAERLYASQADTYDALKESDNA